MTGISFGKRDRDSFLHVLPLDERVLPLHERAGQSKPLYGRVRESFTFEREDEGNQERQAEEATLACSGNFLEVEEAQSYNKQK